MQEHKWSVVDEYRAASQFKSKAISLVFFKLGIQQNREDQLEQSSLLEIKRLLLHLVVNFSQ
jgi:hypothetical protein